MKPRPIKFARLSASILLLCLAISAMPARAQTFSQRGYYITFMRMPTFGLNAWKKAIDCIQEDTGNTVILWMAGGFRSKKYPETWEYNKDHANIKHDFVKKLIDYAHQHKVKVLLGFTPFGYDGVNRMSLNRPDWKATGPDGKPTAPFGIHCWGYNLCPALPDTQKFMREYVREMYFDFYPNADGLFIESSDYAICHCAQCGPRFFDNEFRFVKAISEDVWAKNPHATVAVYPHYFSGANVPGMNVKAAKQPFDSRWTLVFTPHSAHPEPDLIARAHDSIWSDDAPARRTPKEIRENAIRAAQIKCTAYLPSLEAFSFVATDKEEGQQYLVGKRQIPFGFGWLKTGEMPYATLPVRVNRIAYREYSQNPNLAEESFRSILGRELFGENFTQESVDDALALQRMLATDRTWVQAAPITSPERVRIMKAAGQLTPAKQFEYSQMLNRIRQIAERYNDKGKQYKEMYGIASWISGQWDRANEEMLMGKSEVSSRK